jgi:hypothetical protein
MMLTILAEKRGEVSLVTSTTIIVGQKKVWCSMVVRLTRRSVLICEEVPTTKFLH